MGNPIEHPLIMIELPGRSEVDRGEGLLRVRDNGPGLTPEMAELALKAGFSGSDNPYDSLGLFGMGFNISTGKLGRKTRFVTGLRESTHALSVVIDLVVMQSARSYRLPANALLRSQMV